MIPPLLLLRAIPRILLFVIPIFITVKVKGTDDDSIKKQQSDPDPGDEDT